MPTGAVETAAQFAKPVLAGLGGVFLGGALIAWVRGEDVSRMWEGDAVEMVVQAAAAAMAILLVI